MKNIATLRKPISHHILMSPRPCKGDNEECFSKNTTVFNCDRIPGLLPSLVTQQDGYSVFGVFKRFYSIFCLMLPGDSRTNSPLIVLVDEVYLSVICHQNMMGEGDF